MVLVLWDVDQTLPDIGTVDRQVRFSLCADVVLDDLTGQRRAVAAW
jgi:hypothetical protein